MNKVIGIIAITILTLGKLTSQVYSTTGTSSNWLDASAWTCIGCTFQPIPPVILNNQAGTTININHDLFIPSFIFGGPTADINLNATITTNIFTVGFGAFQPTDIQGTGSIMVSGDVQINTNNNHLIGVDVFADDFTLFNGGTVNMTGDLTLTGTLNAANTGGAGSVFNNVTANALSIGTGNLVFNGAVDVNSVVSGQVGSGADVIFNSTLTTNGGPADFTNSTSIELNGNTTVGAVTVAGSSDIDGNSSFFSFTSLDFFDGSVCGFTDEDIVETLINPIDFAVCAVLPIRLNFFDVERIKGSFYFAWETAEETNNDFFTIEYSYDVEQFIPLRSIDGAGNSSLPIFYDYVDNELNVTGLPVIYFRLKQTDFDGTFTYSDIVAIPLDNSFKTEIVPNPTNGPLTIRLFNYEEEKIYNARLTNLISRSVEKEFEITSNETVLDLSDLPKGVYILMLEDIILEPVKVVIN